MGDKDDLWKTVDEPEPDTPFAGPTLESVLNRAKTNYLTPRKREDEKLAVTIRSIPADLWDMVWLIKHQYPGAETMSLAQGCLVHCGLAVVEDILKNSQRGEKPRLEAIESDDLNGRYEYIERTYKPIHLGSGKVETVTVFCLSENDRCRIVDISHTYGLAIGTVAMLAMTAGVAQSTSFLPKPFRKRAKSEVNRFKRWLKDSGAE